jgi:hypothetical protein
MRRRAKPFSIQFWMQCIYLYRDHEMMKGFFFSVFRPKKLVNMDEDSAGIDYRQSAIQV